MSYRHASTPEGEVTGAVISISLVVLAVLLVGVLLGIWLSIKAAHLVVRTLIRYTDGRKPILITLSVFACSLLLLAIAHISVLTVTVCVLSLGALLATTRIVELYHEELCLPKKEPLVEEILHKPWWPNTAGTQAAA